MATILPGPALSDIRGSVGGVTFSRNRGGAYARARVTTTNPNTPKQTVTRQHFGQLISTWKNLTSAQRQAWVTLGGQMIRHNRVAQVYTLTGSQAFQSVNIVRSLFGLATDNVAPILSVFPDIPPLTAVVDAAPADVIGVIGSVFFTEGDRFLIKAAGPRSAGQQYITSSQFKVVLAAVAGAAQLNFSFAAQWVALFGSLEPAMAGARCSFTVTPVSSSFIAGEPVRVDTFAIV